MELERQVGLGNLGECCGCGQPIRSTDAVPAVWWRRFTKQEGAEYFCDICGQALQVQHLRERSLTSPEEEG